MPRPPSRNAAKPTRSAGIGPECFSDEEELVICWKGRNYYADPADEVNLIAEVEALRAQVARVRDVCNVAVHVNDHPDVAVGWLEATASVLRALDGDA